MSFQKRYEALGERISAELNTDAFKNVQVEHRAAFHDFLIAQEAIKKYIQTHDCILYGGTAIDYALRLRGDKIYADSDIPDFDFWSPTHIETALEIINILSVLIPGTNVYGTRAKFVRTMRVSVGDNNWVADISYVSRELFASIPTLIFDGMRIVHPHAQFSDLHSSLAYPYDGAPFEVVFARWKKDIIRFNKLFTAYPLEMPRDPLPEPTQIAIPRDIASHTVLHGFAAYSLYYDLFKSRSATESELSPSPLWPRARPPKVALKSRDDESSDSSLRDIIVDVPFDIIEILAHRNIIPRWTEAKNPRRFYPFLDFLEASVVATVGRATLIAYSTSERLANYNSFKLPCTEGTTDRGAVPAPGSHPRLHGVKLGQVRIRAVSIHGLLKYFIACYLRAKYFSRTQTGPPIGANVYLAYYMACLEMARKSRKTSIESYFDPTLEVFGESSIPLHELIAMHDGIVRMIAPDKLCSKPLLPTKNLRARSTADSRQPRAVPFDYARCEVLKISGEEVLTS